MDETWQGAILPVPVPGTHDRGYACGTHLPFARQGVVSCLFLVGACSAFCNSDWPHMVCPLSLAVFLGDSMLTGHAGYVFIVEGCPLRTSCTWCMNVQHYSRFGNVMDCPTQTDTTRFFFAQKDHMPHAGFHVYSRLS